MATLNEITQIQTGVFLKPEISGDTLYLQIKDFDSRGELIVNPVPGILMDSRLERHLLQSGDILFAAKGSKNFATVFSGLNFPAVASSAFFVLRKNASYLPDYVAWYINHPVIQKKLKFEAKGSSIPSISIGAVQSLEVVLPDLNTQGLIVKIEKLRSKERKLKAELDQLKEDFLDQKIFSIIKDRG